MKAEFYQVRRRVPPHLSGRLPELDGGKTETLRLTDRAAADAGRNIDATGTTRIAVYYTDESGEKVAHYFRKVK